MHKYSTLNTSIPSNNNDISIISLAYYIKHINTLTQAETSLLYYINIVSAGLVMYTYSTHTNTHKYTHDIIIFFVLTR